MFTKIKTAFPDCWDSTDRAPWVFLTAMGVGGVCLGEGRLSRLLKVPGGEPGKLFGGPDSNHGAEVLAHITLFLCLVFEEK